MEIEKIKKRIEKLELDKADLNVRKELNVQEVQRILNEHNETQARINTDINKIDGKIEVLNEFIIIDAEGTEPEKK